MDACRADKFSCYGFERETTPRIDALAREPDSTIFRRHYVQSNWTKPSASSLFTGLFVHQHGVTVGQRPLPPLAPGKGESRRFATQMFDTRFTTLAELLRDLGFATFGIGMSDHLSRKYGFAQGFGEYDMPLPLDDVGRVNTFIDRVRARPGRFFGYLHLLACHNPFPQSTRDPEYLRRYGFEYDEPALNATGIDFTNVAGREMLRTGRALLSDNDVRFLHLIYEAQLRSADQQLIGPLLDGLRAVGRYDHTLILITADHGEELYDHGGYAHGHALWEELIHVPLIVKFPKGRRPKSVDREVTALSRSIDLLPSLVKFGGGAVPAGLPGQVIFQGNFPSFALAEMAAALTTGEVEEWALIRGQQKLIVGLKQTRLFDLASDPKEQRNLASTRPGDVQSGRRFVGALAAAGAGVAPKQVETELTPEAMERLRALGYIH